jgi:hypothetical protein
MATPNIQFKSGDKDDALISKLRRLAEEVSRLGERRTSSSGGDVTEQELEDAIAALEDVYQPLDDDLTTISGQANTAYGLGFLTLADAAAAQAYLGLVPGTDIMAYSDQLHAYASGPIPSPFTLTLMDKVDAAAWQTALGITTGLSGADPTALIGLTTINGSATTFMRSDAAPALDQAIIPTWTGQHTWTQPLWAPDGGVGAPSFSFTSDTTSGWYWNTDPDYGAQVHMAVAGESRITSRAGGSTIITLPDYTAGSTIQEQRPLLIQYSDGPLGGGATALNRYALGIFARSERVGGMTVTVDNGTTFPSVGVQMGFWRSLESGSGLVPPADTLVPPNFTGAVAAGTNGFRYVLDSTGWRFYRHDASIAGSEIWRNILTTDQMLFAAGLVGTPTISFFGDPDTGFYNGAANNIYASTGGVARWIFGQTRHVSTIPIHAPAGVVGAPAYSFDADQDAGIYYDPATRGVILATDGVFILGARPDHVRPNMPMWANLGSVTLPSYSFNGDTNTGMYSTGADALGFATNGVLRLSIASGNITSTFPYLGPNGTAALPTFGWSGDANNGFYYITTDSFGLSTASTLRFQFGAAGQLGIGGATYGTTGYAFKSGGASAPPTWGLIDATGIDLTASYAWTGNHTFADPVVITTTNGEHTLAGHDSWMEGLASTVVAYGGGVGSGATRNEASFYVAQNDWGLSGWEAKPFYLSVGGSKRFEINDTGEIYLTDGLDDYADDAAAAAGGVAITQLYRNGSVVMIRVA